MSVGYRENIPQYACYIGFFFEIFLAVQIEEIVIEHKLAKDTLRGWY